eukprot:SAG31_NODE_1051_length_10157_cov_203.009048_11_plen_71_part_00
MWLELRYSCAPVYYSAVHSAADDQESASVGLYSRVHARPAAPSTAQLVAVPLGVLVGVRAHSGGAARQRA